MKILACGWWEMPAGFGEGGGFLVGFSPRTPRAASRRGLIPWRKTHARQRGSGVGNTTIDRRDSLNSSFRGRRRSQLFVRSAGLRIAAVSRGLGGFSGLSTALVS